MTEGGQESRQPIPPISPQRPHPSILNMTLSQLLNSNPTAQNIVMQSMNLNQNQFQQLLSSTGNNQMMNMTIGDMFKNGTIAQAMQVNPQQMQAVAMGKIDPNTGQMVPLNGTDLQRLQQVPGLTVAQTSQPSLWQKLKDLFR